jgi:hypothetical protein
VELGFPEQTFHVRLNGRSRYVQFDGKVGVCRYSLSDEGEYLALAVRQMQAFWVHMPHSFEK